MGNATNIGQEGGTRILLVDDSRAFLNAEAALLSRYQDLPVVGAIHRGEDILREAQSLQPRVILIGLDAQDLAGLKTISRLRVTLPTVYIIALTMLNGDAYRQAALSAGANEVIAKADLSTDLIPAIRRLVGEANLANCGGTK